jgi:hypothetical protein
MPSSSLRAVAGLFSLVAGVAAQAATPMPSVAAPTLCKATEQVAFSCQLGRKVVSLCTATASGAAANSAPTTASTAASTAASTVASGPPASLAYRYGVPHRIENEFVATPANGLRFLGTVEPLLPDAIVREVWFEKSGYRYLLTACVGGDCPYESGLAVTHGDKLLSASRCQFTQGFQGAFSRNLADFGSDAKTSVSRTPLLEIGDYANDVDKLYPAKGTR